MKQLILYLIIHLVFSTCAQTQNQNNTNNYSNTIKSTNTMDISKISNPQVKQAIEALQNNDKKTWDTFFTKDVVFTDDGNTIDFSSFFENAFKHKEKFLTIEKVEDNGKSISGNFFAGQWGTFNVYFKFHQQDDLKFHRLDIGMVKSK